MLLKECNASKYDAVDKKQFCIKCGTKKACVITYSSILAFTDLIHSKSDATDIESADEFKKFVEKYIILDKRSARPKKVMIWLDIEEVKRVWKTVCVSFLSAYI
jgi:hypothetical protein